MCWMKELQAKTTSADETTKFNVLKQLMNDANVNYTNMMMQIENEID